MTARAGNDAEVAISDRTLVGAFDEDQPGFFWLAGKGGYGMQTSPAMGALAAAAVLGQQLPQSIADQGVSLADLAAGRLVRRHELG